MGGGNLASNSKKKGFAISGILYPLLILTLFLVVQMLFMLQMRKNVLDKARTELSDSINKSNTIYNNEELSILLAEQQKKNEVLENNMKSLQDKITSLESKKLDKKYKAGDALTVVKMPIGQYFNSDPNRYVVIKLGNLKFNIPTMIMIDLKMYQYTRFNSMLIGGYIYVDQGIILQPSVSYHQKSYKVPVSLGVKNNDIYLIIDKGYGGYYGFYVEEMSAFHIVNANAIDSGWSMYSVNSISDFDKIYNCQEL